MHRCHAKFYGISVIPQTTTARWLGLQEGGFLWKKVICTRIFVTPADACGTATEDDGQPIHKRSVPSTIASSDHFKLLLDRRSSTCTLEAARSSKASASTSNLVKNLACMLATGKPDGIAHILPVSNVSLYGCASHCIDSPDRSIRTLRTRTVTFHKLREPDRQQRDGVDASHRLSVDRRDAAIGR